MFWLKLAGIALSAFACGFFCGLSGIVHFEDVLLMLVFIGGLVLFGMAAGWYAHGL